jgi:hypothetical protein
VVRCLPQRAKHDTRLRRAPRRLVFHSAAAGLGRRARVYERGPAHAETYGRRGAERVQRARLRRAGQRPRGDVSDRRHREARDRLATCAPAAYVYRSAAGTAERSSRGKQGCAAVDTESI